MTACGDRDWAGFVRLAILYPRRQASDAHQVTTDGKSLTTSSPVLHTETKRPWAAALQAVDRASDAEQDSRDRTAAGGVSAATWRRSWVATTSRPAPSEPSLRGSSGERLTYSQTLRKGAAVRGGPQRSTSRRSGTSVKTDPPSVSGRIGR